ncbi:hypothetical protein CRYUN_Cryun10bG0022900 [Craigia yunnanensis]
MTKNTNTIHIYELQDLKLVGYSAPTQSAIREDLNLSLAEFSMFGSILTIGAMLGAVTSGRIAELIGRKGLFSALLTGWLAVYFSKGALSLDIGRFSTGYGIGVYSYVVPVFIAEIAPKNLRGGLTTLNQLMIVTGSSVAFLIGTIIPRRELALTGNSNYPSGFLNLGKEIRTTKAEDKTIILIFGFGLVPCLFLLVGLCFIPESPRWLTEVGLNKEFQVALQKLRGKGADITQQAAEIQIYVETLQSLPRTRILDLFQQKYIRSLIIGVALMVFQQFGGINGISFYASETFASARKTGTIAYACVQVGNCPPSTICGFATDGSNVNGQVSAPGTFLGCFLAGTSFYLKDHNLLPEWVPILAVGVLVNFPNKCVGSGWQLGGPCELARCLGSLLHIQLSYELEFLRNLFCLLWILNNDYPICSKVCPRNKRKNTRRNINS